MVRFGRIPSFSFPNYRARLPEHYYKHLQELKKAPSRVHDRAPATELLDLKWNDKVKRVERVPDMPIPVLYPKEADHGLWGGEGIVKGYIKPRKYFQAGWPRPKYWFPTLKKVVLHSEILDQHFSLIVTERTLELVDEHHGLDSYILRTPVEDLKSQLALMLKRSMLLKLARKDFASSAIADEMTEKYQDCIIPESEAEWFGLSVKDAMTKHKIETAKNNPKLPLKYQLSRDLIAQLEYKKNNPDVEPPTPESSGSGGLFGKVKSTLGLGKN